MPPSPDFCGEDERASIMSTYGLDALEDDPELAQITAFAAKLCDAPVALVSLVEEERQRFLARAGLKERETPRPTSFCAHAMLRAGPMVVPDARDDDRFSTNPLVTGHPHIRFYAGAPLISHEGAPLGSLCVIDTQPRPEGLTALQREGLEVLAASVMRRLRLRRENLAAEKEMRKRERRLRTLADTIPDIAFSTNGEGEFDYLNRKWFEFTGREIGAGGTLDEDLVHEDDRERMMAEWRAALHRGEPLEAEARLYRSDGEYRWMLIRATPAMSAEGSVDRWFGTMTDVDVGHRLSESRDLLARELSHRIKNIFAVVTSLVSLRVRKWPEARDFADDLNSAIRALGRAHDYVRPLGGYKGDELIGLLDELMKPYADGNDRISIVGDDFAIGPRAATPIALVFHELATNSAKYGALSGEEGTVAITTATDAAEGMVTVTWRERGGPEPVGDADEGFGSRLIRMSVEGQLKGAIERHWRDGGVDVDLSVPMTAIRD